MAEQMSTVGIPVFLADVKGDVSGVAAPGIAGERITERAADTGTDLVPTAFPAEFLALGGLGTGVPVRATMTSFGPVLLSKVLGLNETQESRLGLVFHFADGAGLLLLDLKDLRAVIHHLVSDEGKADLKGLGGLSTATAGVVLRELIGLEDQGGDVGDGTGCSAGQAAVVQHLPHVAAGRPVPRPARGRRRRAAQARLLRDADARGRAV